MNDEWAQLQDLFEEICFLDEDSRRLILDRKCHGNEILRKAAERMVRAYQEERSANAEARASSVGRRFGVWQTERLLARGGMGEVWLARRADGQHEQKTALKILSPYLAAPDSLHRFRRERELLARLEHPNIARLLDGGMSAQGEPYLVMEYVEGVRLDRYCDERRLPVRQRLQLFLKVCAAVNAAHQYLVVHRDLKPSNILVTADGEPRLLDFGIAKLLAGDDSQTGEMTQPWERMLTPVSASPEQASGEAVTLATDVYSLGVLLYRLLTGVSPYAGAKDFASDPGRVIREYEPPLASSAGSLSRRARASLEGDLDNILRK